MSQERQLMAQSASFGCVFDLFLNMCKVEVYLSSSMMGSAP